MRMIKVKQQTFLNPEHVSCIEYWTVGQSMGEPNTKDEVRIPPVHGHARIWTLNGYPLDISMTERELACLLLNFDINILDETLDDMTPAEEKHNAADRPGKVHSPYSTEGAHSSHAREPDDVCDGPLPGASE